MKDSRILRFLIGITMSLAINLFPLGAIFANQDKINEILDKAKFENIVVNFVGDIASKQLEQSNLDTSNTEVKSITANLIKTEDLKIQRIKAVQDIYSSIENSKVPVIQISIINPLKQIASTSSITSLGVSQQINGILEDLFDTSKEDNKDFNITNETITISTSLGISDSNIQQINLIYKVLKYGPTIALIATIILLVLGYIITLPDTLFAKNIMLATLKIDLMTAITIFVIPYLFRFSNVGVTSLSSSTTPELEGFGQILAYEFMRNMILLPMIFTISALLFWGVVLLYKKTTEASNGFGRYEAKEEEEENEDEVAIQEKSVPVPANIVQVSKSNSPLLYNETEDIKQSKKL
jgi:hypothetical protein